jgi:hypothetical protein
MADYIDSSTASDSSIFSSDSDAFDVEQRNQAVLAVQQLVRHSRQSGNGTQVDEWLDEASSHRFDERASNVSITPADHPLPRVEEPSAAHDAAAASAAESPPFGQHARRRRRTGRRGGQASSSSGSGSELAAASPSFNPGERTCVSANTPPPGYTPMESTAGHITVQVTHDGRSDDTGDITATDYTAIGVDARSPAPHSAVAGPSSPLLHAPRTTQLPAAAARTQPALSVLRVPGQYLAHPRATFRKALMNLGMKSRSENRRQEEHSRSPTNLEAAADGGIRIAIEPDRNAPFRNSNLDMRSPDTPSSSSSSSGSAAGGSARSTTSSISPIERITTTVFQHFDSVVAFRAAFDFEYNEAPQGEIGVTDVLLSVFLWIEPQQSTLLAISGVCRFWREAAARLPQWAITHELMYAEPAILKLAEPRVGPYTTDEQTDLLLGVAVENRLDYIATMRARSRLLHWAHGELQSLNRRCVPVLIEYRVLMVIQLLIAFVILAIAYGVGGGAASISLYKNSTVFDSDDKVGAFVFFISVAFVGVMFQTYRLLHKACTPVTVRQRNLRRRLESGLVLLMYTFLIVLATPAGLTAARLAQAYFFRSQPKFVYSSNKAECNVLDARAMTGDAGTRLPYYVEIEDVWDWRLEPWQVDIHAYPSVRQLGAFNWTDLTKRFRPLCEVPSAAQRAGWPQWWADTYLDTPEVARQGFSSRNTNDLSHQCVDQLGTTSSGNLWQFLLLYPPSRIAAACSPAPIAIPYDPTNKDFNMTYATLWTTNANRYKAAQPGDRTSFRTAVQSQWFPLKYGVEQGAAWYSALLTPSLLNGTNAPTTNASDFTQIPGLPVGTVLPNATWAYLWDNARVPMIVPWVVQSVDDLIAEWWERMLVFAILPVTVFGLAFACALCSRRTCPAHAIIGWAGIWWACGVQPGWLVGWGATCYFGDYPDLCFMTKSSSLALFIIGLIETAALINLLIASSCS